MGQLNVVYTATSDAHHISDEFGDQKWPTFLIVHRDTESEIVVNWRRDVNDSEARWQRQAREVL